MTGTIAYLDVSGGMTVEMMQEGLRKVAGSCELRVFDHRVRDMGMTVEEARNAENLFSFNGGGGTLLAPVIEDFKASGAYSCYVISDGYFMEGRFYGVVPQGLLMKLVVESES